MSKRKGVSRKLMAERWLAFTDSQIGVLVGALRSELDLARSARRQYPGVPLFRSAENVIKRLLVQLESEHERRTTQREP